MHSFGVANDFCLPVLDLRWQVHFRLYPHRIQRTMWHIVGTLEADHLFECHSYWIWSIIKHQLVADNLNYYCLLLHVCFDKVAFWIASITNQTECFLHNPLLCVWWLVVSKQTHCYQFGSTSALLNVICALYQSWSKTLTKPGNMLYLRSSHKISSILAFR